MSVISRRRFVSSVPALVGGASLQSACSQGADLEGYEAFAARTWQVEQPGVTEGSALNQELVRYATLAPSSHNTQCWKFALDAQAITILPDLSRRCLAVDPDDHHVFVMLGCAAGNLAQSALAHGLHAEARFDANRDAIHVVLTPTKARSSPLFNAIPMWQCTRGDYDGQQLSREELALFETASTSDGVKLPLLTELHAMERALEYVVQGNIVHLADPAFLKELKSWIRLKGAAAVRSRNGPFSTSSGNLALPSWMGNLAFDWFFTTKSENDKIARQIRNSAGIAVFVGQAGDKAHWVEVGRCYERFALQAAALGIRNAFLNQPAEVAAVRSPLAAALGTDGERPGLVVRFGRGPSLPPSLCRPVQAVLV